MAKRPPLTCVYYLMDQETGKTMQIKELPPEALAKMRERLSRNMSDYYSRHMDQYVRLRL